MRHKHKPIGIYCGGDYIIQKCECGKRRVSHVQPNSTTRWFSKDDNDMVAQWCFNPKHDKKK